MEKEPNASHPYARPILAALASILTERRHGSEEAAARFDSRVLFDFARDAGARGACSAREATQLKASPIPCHTVPQHHQLLRTTMVAARALAWSAFLATTRAFVIPAKRSTAPARRASLRPHNIPPLRTTFLPAAPLDTSDEPTDDGFWRDSGTWVIVVCYFLQGALGLSRLALNFYLKDELHLSPGDLAALTGLATAPWVVKPLYGLVSDSTPLLGFRRKSYVALSGLVGAASFAAMATVASSTAEALIAANVVASGAVALSDVVVDSLVVEKARDEAEAASLQSVAWSSRYVGAILASLASGAALEALGARGCFGATAFLPLLLCVAALGIDEEPQESKESFWDEGLATLVALKDALLSPAILRPAAFLFLW